MKKLLLLLFVPVFLQAQETQSRATFYPSPTNTYDLGKYNAYWDSIFARYLKITNVNGFVPRMGMSLSDTTKFLKYSDTTSVVAMQWELDGKARIDTVNQRLPLWGGTLTGILTGTSANFSGSISADGTVTAESLSIGTIGLGVFQVDRSGTLQEGVVPIARISGKGTMAYADSAYWRTLWFPQGDTTKLAYLDKRNYFTQNMELDNDSIIVNNGSLYFIGDGDIVGVQTITASGLIKTTDSLSILGGGYFGRTLTVDGRIYADTLSNPLTALIVNDSLTITGALSGTSASFTGGLKWGTSGATYMYAGGIAHIFAYADATSNVLYSGGAGGLGINNAADAVRIIQFSDAGDATFAGTVSPTVSGGDLGSASYRWSLFADTINISAGALIAGNTTVGGEFTLSNTVWDDISVSAQSSKQGQTDKPLFVPDSVAYKFIADSTEYIYGSVEMPHGWKIGTDLHPHVHVLQTAANDTAHFAIEWKWHNLGNAGLDGAWHWTEMATRELTYVSGSMMQLTETQIPIPGSGKTLSSVLLFKLKRLNGFGLTNSYVYNVGFHYEIDALGSKDELTK